MGPTLSPSVSQAWAGWNHARLLRYRDLKMIAPFASNFEQVQRDWWRSRLSPDLLVRHLSDSWNDPHLQMFDRWGWRIQERRSVAPEYYAEKLEARRKEYLPYWKDFAISPEADRCLRALLDLCRARGIKVFLYEMPESTDFNAFYPPGARAQIEAYLRRITSEYAIPWVNARGWVADSGYVDGLHMIVPGAEEFTQRFRREVLGPFAREWPVRPGPHEASGSSPEKAAARKSGS